MGYVAERYIFRRQDLPIQEVLVLSHVIGEKPYQIVPLIAH